MGLWKERYFWIFGRRKPCLPKYDPRLLKASGPLVSRRAVHINPCLFTDPPRRGLLQEISAIDFSTNVNGGSPIALNISSGRAHIMNAPMAMNKYNTTVMTVGADMGRGGDHARSATTAKFLGKFKIFDWCDH